MLYFFSIDKFQLYGCLEKKSNAICISAFLFYKDWDIRRYNYTFDTYFIIPKITSFFKTQN